MRGNKKGTRVRQIRSRVPPDGKRATILDDFDGFYAIDWVLDGFSTPELADCLAAFALRFFHGMGSRIPDYRRYRAPGDTCFFTVNLLERRLDTLVRHMGALREAVRVTLARKVLLYKNLPIASGF